MTQLQRLLWLTGLLVGTGNLVAAQTENEQKKQTVEAKPNSTLKIKASFEARGAYDFKNYYAKPGFCPATIPMKSDADNRKRFLFDIPSATLSIEKGLLLSGEEAIKLVIQTNLKKELALKSVYAEFKGFRIGKATTNFCDSDACDLVSGRFVQARWQHKLTPLFSFAVALEEAPDLVIYPKEKEEDQDKKPLQPHKNIPAVSANLQYTHTSEVLRHVQIGGLFRFLEYRNTQAAQDYYIPCWGVNLGTALHFIPEQTIFKLQCVYGQGIGGYIVDLGDLEEEVNTVYTNKDEKSGCRTLDAWGIGVGLTHKWLLKLRSEVAYRLIYTMNDERDQDAYGSGQAVSINLFYHPTEQIKIGTEYLYGARKNIGGDLKNAHRMQAVVGVEL